MRINIGICIISLFFFPACKPENDDNKVKEWFDEGALNCDTSKDLHFCSQWKYLSSAEFAEVVNDSLNKLDPPIKDGESVFDLGVGVGAAFQVMVREYKDLTIGGSDISKAAIDIAKRVFPFQADNFFVHDMTKRHTDIANGTYDHTLSLGALAMYLTKEQMLQAAKEALRITKSGGSLVFTSFIAPGGQRVGSIVEPVEKSFLLEELPKYGAENIKIYNMKHQGDRYQVAMRKK